MSTTVEIRILHTDINDNDIILQKISEASLLSLSDISTYRILRKSLDARKKDAFYQLKIEVFSLGEVVNPIHNYFELSKQEYKKTCHIIGAGPAGLFAALQCLERKIKPIILERGKDVHTRLKDISAIHKNLVINPESNYCYGEGGAGTYSDGKLYTRSSKRGNVQKVLDTFIRHGAPDRIGYEAHPHIGTNKLPKIIENIRNYIVEMGGEIYFDKKLVDFNIRDNKIVSLICEDNDVLKCESLILATGHSARDIFYMLQNKNILIEAKPFAIGVRVEHHQSLIDSIQYKSTERAKTLPPASYSLVTQACGKGVFSFCMCPGGVIAPAGTAHGEIVVNGWSSSARNGPYSNSGMVVEVNDKDWQQFKLKGALAGLSLQQEIEQKAFQKTGSLVAPAQRMEDFLQGKLSTNLPRTSYQPGLKSENLDLLLPEFITQSLREALKIFGKKMYGYRTNEAVLVGVESRTSSPIRIPRDKEGLFHPQITNLFPCGEGAGYAGGIVSAAIDGMACAMKI